MKTYCYEYHSLWYSYPCEPITLPTGLVIDQALGIHNNRKGEGVTTGEVEATSLRAAKTEVSRLVGMRTGKWEKSYHPYKDEYFPCHVKDNQNRIFLWEKEHGEAL